MRAFWVSLILLTVTFAYASDYINRYTSRKALGRSVFTKVDSDKYILSETLFNEDTGKRYTARDFRISLQDMKDRKKYHQAIVDNLTQMIADMEAL